MTTDLKRGAQNHPRHLSPEGLEQCKQNGNRNTDAVIKAALNTDLREIGDKFLPDDINRGKVDYIQGPCVLQIQKSRNVSAPKENEDSQGAPRLLKLTLTDGQQNCGAVEIEPVDKIGLNTPPGTKVQLLGTVQIEHGFLLLNNKNTRFLGGQVEKMVDSWQLKRTLAKQSRTGTAGEGGPPLFVPFGQRIGQDKALSNRRDNFKSLEVSKEKKEENGEFEQQRKATIAEALQGKHVKTFGGIGKPLIQDKDVAKMVEMGFTPDDATVALRQNQGSAEAAINALLSGSVTGVSSQRGRGYQRAPPSHERGERPERGDRSDRGDKSDGRPGGRGRKSRETIKENEGEDVPTRPSGPATLFDFLETKMTIKDDPKTDTKDNSSKTSSSSRPESSTGYQGRPQSSYTSKSQPQPTNKQQDQRSQGQGFSQNRRQNLPPRLANKFNRDSEPQASGRPQGQRGYTSYNNYNNSSKQQDGSESSSQYDRNNYSKQNSYDQGSYSGDKGGNYSSSNRNNYKGSDRKNNDSSDRNSYRSDRNNYNASEKNNYNSADRNSYAGSGSYGGSGDRNNYSGSDRNSNRNRSTNNDRSQGQTNTYQKPDFSTPPPMTYDSGHSSQYSSGQYTYQPNQGCRPTTVPYNTNYNPAGIQGDWGQQPEYQANMSAVYMQNNGNRGPREWQRGDKCLAPYCVDGQFYNAVIEALSHELTTCAVLFTEYGNSEVVPLDSLRTLPKHARGDSNWQGGAKAYSSHSVKPMMVPHGMAYAPPIAGDESLFAANHITSMEFRRGGGGTTYQKRPDRQGGGGGRNQGY